MKLIIYFIALVMVPILSYADKMKDSQIIGMCEIFETMANDVMTRRQDGESISTLMKSENKFISEARYKALKLRPINLDKANSLEFEKMFGELFSEFVIAAYELPRLSDELAKKEIIEKWRDETFLSCYKGLQESETEVVLEVDQERQSQLKALRVSYINQIASRVKSQWRYKGAKDNWGCDVNILQDKQGNVKSVNVQSCVVDNQIKMKSFRDSIERAVNKSSPLPIAPDKDVFKSEILFNFRVN